MASQIATSQTLKYILTDLSKIIMPACELVKSIPTHKSAEPLATHGSSQEMKRRTEKKLVAAVGHVVDEG